MSVPVFLEAPLVRFAPSLCLIVGISLLWLSQKYHNDYLWGFTMTWLCGAIYWGWCRFEPVWHLPIETLALPWVVWRCQRYRVGAHFYIGSLLGTALTDGYFYVNGLMPFWRELMRHETDPLAVRLILAHALELVANPWGRVTAVVWAVILLAIALKCMVQSNPARWALAGALLGTILVDLLFYSSSLSALNG